MVNVRLAGTATSSSERPFDVAAALTAAGYNIAKAIPFGQSFIPVNATDADSGFTVFSDSSDGFNISVGFIGTVDYGSFNPSSAVQLVMWFHDDDLIS
jgi:hypothetical protein